MNLEHDGILFFDLTLTGHHMEFLFHLMSYRSKHPELPPFIFLIHPDYIRSAPAWFLPRDIQGRGLRLIHPNEDEMHLLNNAGPQENADLQLRILSRGIEESGLHRCCIMALNKLEKVLGSRAGRSLPCVLTGIYFAPFTWDTIENRQKYSIRGLVKWLIKYLEMAWMLRNRNLKKIFLLNDESSAQRLNRIYNRPGLFYPLADPVFRIPDKHVTHGNLYVGSDRTRKRLLLFGSLASRKGIFLALEAVASLPDQIAGKIELVYAGPIDKKEKTEFLSGVERVISRCPSVSIRIIDHFIDYESIPDWFKASDCIIIPYTSSEGSSGIIGHAALYDKPLIGPRQGLLGSLIRKYDLGQTLESIAPTELAAAMTRLAVQDQSLVGDYSGMRRYVLEHEPDRFVETLIEPLLADT
ncbi:hypothetical protein ER57_15805 [Smithella sp. SCADC]|jgi:glycosyltransferase involved in cell wall biosynthesis|nr:hypothetical protein ER57_15805 [Smithella sp. SCADC]